MDPGRIHAYLQAACSGLGFDVGEVWFSSTEVPSSPSLTFGESPKWLKNQWKAVLWLLVRFMFMLNVSFISIDILFLGGDRTKNYRESKLWNN